MKKRKQHKRSPCPIACSLDIIGDKWTLLIVRDLVLGRSHFREFISSPEQIATNILSNRLARLMEYELIEKFPSDEQPGREAYRLTEKGRTLAKIVKALADWGLENIAGTETRLQEK